MQLSIRRTLLPIVVFAALAAAGTASAAPAATPDSGISAVNVADDAHGSVVRVSLAGRHRPRLLRSVERLAAIVIADVDFDGDLDIVAATVRDRLVLWRNAGRGRFVLMRLRAARQALRAGPRVTAAVHATAQQPPGETAGDAAIPRGAPARDPLVLRSFVHFDSFSPLARASVAPTGRAPPRPS